MIPSSSKLSRWKYLLFITTIVVVVYGQTAKFGFVNYDDDELIYHNETFLSQWKNMGTAFAAHAFVGAGGKSIYYRPLLVVTLITDYHRWHLNPLGYHLTNVIFHIATVLLVFILLHFLLGNELLALFSALIFAFHPIQTESVGWIAGRNDIMLGFFVVLMMLFYIRSQEVNQKPNHYKILAIAAFTLALFTKESAVFYLLLFPVYDLCYQNKTIREIISIKYIRRFWIMGSVLLFYFIIRWNIFGTVIGAEQMYGKDKPFIDRIARVPGIFSEHLQLLVAPINLSVAHPLSDILWLQEPWYIGSIIVVCLFAAVIWLTWRRNRVVCFGLLWVGIGLLPVLNIIPMPKPILEHRLYVPMVGTAIVVGYGIDRLLIRSFLSREKYIILSALCIGLGFMTYARLPVWENGITLFTDAVQKAPNDLHSNYSLARAYYDASLFNESITSLRKYLTLAPNDLRAYRFLREDYYITGQRTEVAKVCKKMIEIDSGNSLHYLETGVIYEELNMFDTAAIYYRQGLLLDPSNAELYYRMGTVNERMKQYDLAERSYRQAISANSNFSEAYIPLAKLLVSHNDLNPAIILLEYGLNFLKPSKDYVELLSDLYLKSGETTKKIELRQRYKF